MSDIQRGLVELLHDLDRRARPGREPKNRSISKFTTLSDTVQLSSETVTTNVQTPPYQYARQSYRSAVIADAPLAYLRFGEYAPAVTANDDSSGSTNHAAYGTDVTLGYNQPGNSEPNLAVHMGATSSGVVTVPTSALNPLNRTAYSIEFWRNADTLNAVASIGGKAATTGTNEGLAVFANLDGSVTYQRYANSVNTAIASSSGSVSTGVWAHIVATFDGTTTVTAQRLYINGLLKASGLSTGLTATTTTVNVQVGFVTGLGLSARAAYQDEFATYAAALSSDRILAHYNAMTTPTATGTSLVVGAGQFR